MRTIYSVLSCVMLLSVANYPSFGQEKAQPWSIGHYMKPVPAVISKKAPNLKSTLSVSGISTNNVVYPSSNPQTEVSGAISKSNSQDIMVAANTVTGGLGQGWYATTDGGLDWYGSDYYPNGSENLGDPVMLSDLNGNFYYAVIGYNNPYTYGIEVTKTTNMGTNWLSTVNADPTLGWNVDKPMGTVDNSTSSPYKGNIYLAWTDYSTTPSKVVLSKSANGGTIWSSSLKVLDNTTTWGQGTSLAVGPNGQVYVAWADYPNNNLPSVGMGFVVSTDSGHTFTSFNGTSAFSYTGIRYTNVGETEFGGIRVNDFPSIAVDKSNGPYRGYIYAVVAENTGGSTMNSDVKFARSTDGGTTWQTGFTNNTGYVNTYRTAQQFFPWISVDDVTGRISVTYYSQDTVGYAVDTYVGISDDGGATFQNYKMSDVSHTPQALNGYKPGYSGDYINVVSYGTKIYPFWMDNRTGSQNYQIYFSYSIPTVDQKHSNSVTFGTVNRWNGSTFASVGTLPATISDPNFANDIFQGEQDINSAEKYNAWYVNNSEIADVTNHHVFSILPKKPGYLSQFEPTYSGVTIENYLIDNGTYPSNTTVSFSDPWLIDYADPSYGNTTRNQGMSAPFKSRTSPFNPDFTKSFNGDVYQGILTNQSGPPNWTSPYYSVGFPTGQTISVGGTNHQLYFYNWLASGANIQNSTSNQTGVEFTSSSATVTAKVKGNLLSSVSSATGYGNQSKIVRDYQGNLNMVYASAGEIWYTKSTNNGQTWSPEVRISAGDGYARNPSIAQWYCSDPSYQNPYELCVVWVDAYQSFLGFSWNVFYNGLQISSNTWGSPQPVDDPPSGGVGYARSNSKPAASLVVNSSYQYTTIAFEGAGTGIIIKTQNTYGTWYSNTLSSDTTCQNPDLFTANFPSLGGFLMYLTYDNGYNIYMRYASNPAPGSGTPSFGSPYTVNNGIQCSGNTSGGITVDGAGTVRFSWRGFDPLYYYQYAIWERSLSWAGWNWSSPVEFATTSTLDQPTICGHLNSNFGATIMFHNAVSTNPVYEVTSTNGGGSWNGGGGNLGVQITTNAAYPNLPSTSDPTQIPFALTTTNTTPYALRSGTRNDVTGTGTLYKQDATGGGLRFSQVIQVVDSINGMYAAFNLSNMQLSRTGAATISGQLVQTSCDSTNQGVLEISPLLSSLVSTTGVNLTFSGNFKAKEVKGGVSISLALVDSASNTPFMSLIERNVADSVNQLTNSAFSLAIPSTILQRNTKLAVLIDGKPDTTAQLTLVNVYSLNDTSTSNGSGETTASVPLPTDYNLSQNYPNPFNPTTTIEYAVPVSGHVTLRIYDVLGREVKTLVNEDEPAGFHSVVFDANQFPSGVYFYRISAGKFTSVKKLVLVK